MKKLFALFFVAVVTSFVDTAQASPIGIEAVPPVVSTEKNVSPE